MTSRDHRGRENGYASSDSDDQDLISPSKIRPTFRRDPGLAVKSMASPLGNARKLEFEALYFREQCKIVDSLHMITSYDDVEL
jgi:hypothetical protein